MDQQQQTSADAFVGAVRATVDAGAEQLKQANESTLAASRTVLEAYAQAANVLQGRFGRAVRVGLAAAEAGISANRDHLNRLVEARNLQDVVRLQMQWGANQTIAVFGELKKIGDEAARDRSS
mgnify:CR=1 FL=1